MKELKLRGQINRILIVVPAGLRFQWRRELEEKFREDFLILDSHMLRTNPSLVKTHNLIISLDLAKKPRITQILRDTGPWDLTIFDEAHKLRVYRKPRGEESTLRFRLGKVISQEVERLLLLTATPHQGDDYAFYRLLTLLDPLIATGPADIEKDKVFRLMIRHLKDRVKDFQGRPLLKGRKVETISVKLSEEERELYKAVRNYTSTYYNLALDRKNRGAGFAMVILQRRLASSTIALLRTLERRLRKLMDLKEKQVKEMPAVIVAGDSRVETYYNALISDRIDATDRKREETELSIAEEFTPVRSLEELNIEIEQLQRLVNMTKTIVNRHMDSKVIQLLQFVEKLFKQDPGEKLLIFTEWTDTLEHLKDLLEERGYRVASIHGRMDMDERLRQEQYFKESSHIMVATDAAGEGINLQFAHLMINFELPWNPTRIEQRMGRLHRYLQARDVIVWNLFAEGTIESMVLQTLFRKLEAIRKALGREHVFDVIGTLLSRVKLHELIMQAITGISSPEEVVREIEREIEEQARSILEDAERRLLIVDEINLPILTSRLSRLAEVTLNQEDVRYIFLRAHELYNGKLEYQEKGFFKLRRLPEFVPFYSPWNYRLPMMVSFEEKTYDIEHIDANHDLFKYILECLDKYWLGEGPVTVKEADRPIEGVAFVYESKVRTFEGGLKLHKLYCILYDTKSGKFSEIDPMWLTMLPAGKDNPPRSLVEEVAKIYSKAFSMAADKLANEYHQVKEGQEHNRDVLLKDLDEYSRRKERALNGKIGELKGKLELLRVLGDKARPYYHRDIGLLESQIKWIEEQREELHRIVEERRIKIEATVSEIDQVGPELRAIAFILPAKEGINDSRLDVERAGIECVLRYERANGREPLDVSDELRGYDILSTETQGSLRYIEVKSFAHTGDLAFTEHEWRVASRIGANYWVYVVENVFSTPVVYTVRDPYSAFKGVAKEFPVVSSKYIVKEWKLMTTGQG
ncbi:MAG: helicase-related protein [Candidatus Caldarchaeum sp.]